MRVCERMCVYESALRGTNVFVKSQLNVKNGKERERETEREVVYGIVFCLRVLWFHYLNERLCLVFIDD